MDLTAQLKSLRDRVRNLTDHCDYHPTDRDAKTVLKKLRARAKSLRSALKKKEGKGEEKPIVEKKAKVVKPTKKDPETQSRINAFLESRAKIKSVTPIGQ